MSRKEQMVQAATDAAKILKLLSHPERLLLVCSLVEGEKSVNCLVNELGIRQSTVSQYLAKLRELNVVKTRREGQIVHYSLADPKVIAIVQTMYDQFCPE